MKHKHLIIMIVLLLAAGCGGGGVDGAGGGQYPAEAVYKRTSARELKLFIEYPDSPAADRPAIVFFFGGAWCSRHLDSFVDYQDYFAQRGFVAIRADYRVCSDGPDITPVDSTADAWDAVRWIEDNADRMGVDPFRIIACGASSGSQVAYYTGAPVLILLDEALDLTNAALMQGIDGAPYSPIVTVATDYLVPMFVQVGELDYPERYDQAFEFAGKVESRGGVVELMVSAGAEHGYSIVEPWQTEIMDTVYNFIKKLTLVGVI